jgi:hypothetical protein
LLQFLAAGTFEEVWIDFAGPTRDWKARVGPGGRGASGRVFPELAVFEDLADHVVLTGLNTC